MLRRKIVLLLVMMIVPLLAVVGLIQTSAHAAQERPAQEIEVIADNLSNPRGLTFGPDGALYVAEAGYGGSGACLPNPEGGDPVCYGETGAITRLEIPTATQVVTGLASMAVVTGTAATGPHDVAFNSAGEMVAVIGLGANPLSRTASVELANLGQLISATTTGAWSNWVDIAQYEADENPAGGPLDSNPFSVAAVDDGYIVSDAGMNALLHVNVSGTITVVATFPTRTVPLPREGLPAPDGAAPPSGMDPVPTGVTVGPDGAYYVGELTGFPFPVGGANVYRVVPGEEPEIYASGFTNVVDVAFDEGGNLLVLEIATNSLLSGDPTGALIRVNSNGRHQLIASDGLFMPTGLVIGPDGAAYVSNNGIFPMSPVEGPPTGQVVRITLPPVTVLYFPFMAKNATE